MFKLIQDNFSNNYAIALEIYFERFPFTEKEFNSVRISFEKINMYINYNATKKVNSDWSKLNMSPDSSSKQIQRRSYINFQATYDNDSPPVFPIYVLIYGIKDETLNNIDLSIYDFEKYYEISPLEYFKMHMPIDMNNQPIINLADPAGFKDAVLKSSLSSNINY